MRKNAPWNGRSTAFLNHRVVGSISMRRLFRGRAGVSLLVTGLLVASAVIPLIGVSLAGGAVPTQAQLGTMVSAAESSRAYATGLITYGGAHGVTSSSANSAVSSGDVLLAKAQADLSARTNLEEGVSDARGAMSFYSTAAADVSVALVQNGLAGSVEVDEVAGSIGQVNSTLRAMTDATTFACSSASTSTNSTLVRSCSGARAEIANATLDLRAAVEALAGLSSGADVSVAVSAASTDLRSAREALAIASSSIQSASAFGYEARGEAYKVNVLAALSEEANNSIAADGSILATFNSATAQFGSDRLVLSLASGNLSALATAVVSTRFDSLAASMGASAATSGEVASTSSSLLSLLGNLSLAGDAGLVSAVSACHSLATAYSTSLSPSLGSSAGFASTKVSSFGTYLSGYQVDAQSTFEAQSAYVSGYGSMKADLAAFIRTLVVVPPQLLTYNSTLSTLAGSVASTTSTLSTELDAELASLGELSVDLSSVQAQFSNSGGSNLAGVSTPLYSELKSTYASASVYLNATGYAAVLAAGTGVEASINSTSSYVASVQAALAGTISLLNSSAPSLLAAGAAAYKSMGSASAHITQASSFIAADLSARQSAASGGADAESLGLKLLALQNLSAGVGSLEEAASLFAAASVTYTQA